MLLTTITRRQGMQGERESSISRTKSIFACESARFDCFPVSFVYLVEIFKLSSEKVTRGLQPSKLLSCWLLGNLVARQGDAKGRTTTQWEENFSVETLDLTRSATRLLFSLQWSITQQSIFAAVFATHPSSTAQHHSQPSHHTKGLTSRRRAVFSLALSIQRFQLYLRLSTRSKGSIKKLSKQNAKELNCSRESKGFLACKTERSREARK